MLKCSKACPPLTHTVLSHFSLVRTLPRKSVASNRPLLCTFGFLVLLVSGCEILAPEWKRFQEMRYYTHDFFESDEECAAAQPNPNMWINCSQTAAFCPSGRVEFMVTDIIHRGTYKVEGRRVTLRFPDNPEVDSRVVFLLAADEHSLVHQTSGTQWSRKFDEEAALALYTCS
jgi:hypothetical protein